MFPIREIILSYLTLSSQTGRDMNFVYVKVSLKLLALQISTPSTYRIYLEERLGAL